MIAGLLLAVGCALAGRVAVLLKQRGAVAGQAVLARHPLRSAVNLFCSTWWTVRWPVALGAWLLHVGALSLTPMSMVQAVISGGLVFLAILAERCVGSSSYVMTHCHEEPLRANADPFVLQDLHSIS